MSKTKFFGILLASFVVLAILVMVSLAHATTSLTFVSSHTELYGALEGAEKGTIGSVAIAEKYYQEGTSRVQKNQIRGLIATVFKLNNRAVFIYGSPLDNKLANELLGLSGGCSPAFAVGRIGPQKAVCLLFAPKSEDAMRREIRRNVEYHGVIP